MLIEAPGLAQIHVASELAGMSYCAPNTLHSDGTSKHGHPYATFDRCLTDATFTKFNSPFTEYSKRILPNVVKEWATLNTTEKDYNSTVNEFFCGLHVLVAMADQAEACMKGWEGMLYGDAKLGSLAHGGYSNGESGTTRRIRTVCKYVQERGCEKSGRMIIFCNSYERNLFYVPETPNLLR